MGINWLNGPIQSAQAGKLLTMSNFPWDTAITIPPGYALRFACAPDLPQIVELLLTSFYPENPINRWLYPLMRMGIQEDIKRRIKGTTYPYACLAMVYMANGGPAIVGTAEVSLRSRWPYLQARRPYIANVAVDHCHRRGGLAQKMLLACEAISQTWGLKDIYLHVATNNPAAIALYKKVGYQISRQALPWQQRQMMSKEIVL